MDHFINDQNLRIQRQNGIFNDALPNSYGMPDDENEFKIIPESPFKLFSKWCGEARTSLKHKRDEMWLYGGP